MKKLHKQKGNVMLVTVLFFTLMATTAIVGVTGPASRDFQSVKKEETGKKSYIAAESGIEDVAYRVLNGLQVGSSQTLTVGDATVTTTKTTNGTITTVESLSDLLDFNKSLSVNVKKNIQFTLNKAIEAGYGGFTYGVNNNGYIVGDVVSNGWLENGYTNDITIFGNLTSRNQASAYTADTFESSGPTVTQAIGFGNTSSPKDFAQSFTPTITGPFGQIELYTQGFGANVGFTIETNNTSTDRPSGLILAQGQLSGGGWFSGSYSWKTPSYSFYGHMTPTLYAGQKYWIVLKANGAWWDNHNYIGAYTYSGSEETLTGNYASGSWTATSGARAMYRFTYKGVNGVLGTITHRSADPYTGYNVYSDFVYNTNAMGYNYCNSYSTSYGGGSCDYTYTSPGENSYTITDSMITTWKSDSEAGTVYSGDYTVASSTTVNMGPEKIIGNLTINGTLHLTGPIYVTGNITMGTNGKIELDNSFLTNDGVIVVDGTFSGTSSSNVITGSSSRGSYILIVSLSNCPASCGTTRAITWSGTNGATWSTWWIPLPNPWVGGPMFFAPYGWVKLDSSSYSNYAAGDRVEQVTQARVRHESSAEDMNFAAGSSLINWRENE